MDKNAIKKYAVWARNELIARVSQKALQYGISATECGDENADSVNGVVLSSEEKSQRASLVAKVKNHGFEQAIEEAAYTWFNRFTALRYMEVNGFLPSHIRVFTNEQNEFKPQIIDEAIHLDIDGLDMEKVIAYKTANNKDELYKYLLITQCHALGKLLPEMFTEISDHIQLLFPDNLLREGSVIEQMISMIPEEDWKDQVQIIGWLYQYYNTEPKDKVFADLKKNIKISKENIPAATQLFTPDWIVRYMVENSLGRLWLDGHPDCSAKSEWKYYLEEAEQEESVKAQLDEIRKEYSDLNPEQIRFLDPCMGSGHILVYAFDVFMQIYTSCGYSRYEAVQLIVQKNLYGLDLDQRAYQFAYFAVMMNAGQYDRRFLTRCIKPNLAHFQDLEGVPDANVNGALKEFAEQFRNCDTYGSLTEMHEIKGLDDALSDFSGAIGMEFDKVERMMTIYKILTQKYDVVCTNPPYMGSSGMNSDLSDFVREHYPDSKSDLFAVFIERCGGLAKANGFYAMIVQPSLLFLSSFEKVREKIISQSTISSLLHMGRGIFGIDFGSTAFVINKKHISNYLGGYFRLHERTFQYIDPDDIGNLYLMSKGDKTISFDFSTYDTKNEELELSEKTHKSVQLYHTAKQENFSKIPGAPVAYWISENFYHTFDTKKIDDYASTNNGFTTGDNNKFLRLWFEVNNHKIDYNNPTLEALKNNTAKWFPYNKGGEFRKWYGNNEYVINWENEGKEIKEYGHLVPRSMKYQFRESVTWNKITSGTNGFRYKPTGNMFDVGGLSMFAHSHDDLLYLMAICNSVYVKKVLEIISPTLNCETGHVSSIPVIIDEKAKSSIENIVEENITLSKSDWDSFETSWNFKRHPLI